jgi:hypothetical protein
MDVRQFFFEDIRYFPHQIEAYLQGAMDTHVLAV